MKKRLSFLAAIGVLALSACVKEPIATDNPEGTIAQPVVFTASTETTGTKTALSDNGGGGYQVVWKTGDEILITDNASHRGAYRTESNNSTQASFNYVAESGSEADTAPYQAFYPASLYNGGNLVLPAVQDYTENNIASFPMRGEGDTPSLSFKNLCGIIRLSVTTSPSSCRVSRIILSADEPLSGVFTVTSDAAVISSGTTGVTLRCPDDGILINGTPKDFYIAVPPGTYHNLQITVVTTAFGHQTRTAKVDITVERSKITPISLSFNSIVRDVTDLSRVETANSYIVREAGAYKFKADVAGNGAADLSGISKTISGVSSVYLLWATCGTATAPGTYELIKNVRNGGDGYIYFETGAEFMEGNALIAVKDASDNILWSWHIWFESDDLSSMAHVYPTSNSVMMDRNLGATDNYWRSDNFFSAGLLYEWGRKDPFPNTIAPDPSSGTVAMKGTSTTISLASLAIADAVAHPTTVSLGSISGATWAGSSKTIFDPCPPGWKVPSPSDFSGMIGGGKGRWRSAPDSWHGGFISAKNLQGSTVSVYFPAAGEYGHGHLQHFDQGTASCLYTNTTAYSKSFDFSASINGQMQDKDDFWACSVRCVKDDHYLDPEDFDDISSAAGTANCYIIPTAGQYKFPATVKGNGAATLAGISPTTDANSIASAELVWASFGTTTAPAAGELIREVQYRNGYVYVTTSDPLVGGNAVVAIKDASGNILWSWHLWLTSFNPDTYQKEYYGGAIFMDRNLGALSNAYNSSNSNDYGLLYQWGRKDPFLNAPNRTTYSSTEAAIYGTARDAKNQLYTVAETILHPTDYPYTYNNTPWMTNEQKNIALWSSTKTIFDPCPAGWKVPQKSSWGDYFIGNFTSATPTKGQGVNVVYTPYGNLTTWLPDAGYRQGAPTENSGVYIQGLGIIQHRGDSYYFRLWCSDGILWRDTFSGASGLYNYDVDLLASPWFYYGTYRDNACSVRCVKE